MSQIQYLMNTYISVIQSLGYPVEKYLNPPLSIEQITQQCTHLPFTLPEEIASLYQWHNGVNAACDEFLFRDSQFLTFYEALDAYQVIIENYIFEGVDYGVDLLKCFPFAGFEGCYYVLPAQPQTMRPEFERPVISVFEGVDVHFISLEAFITTCIAWYEEGVRKIGNASVDYNTELEAWKRLNPGVF